ncbi:MAG: DUF4236 domain-containing protein [Betaproteobacteria bacterium]|nr:DUF4236 domain-containing protein [Betaproteobacteria bacterium]
MALRFRRSIKLAPGIRMNLSGSGVSWTLGPRGASIGLGRRGTFLNSGVPGTGLYARERIGSGPSPARAAPPSATVQVTVSVHVDDEGIVTFRDGTGNLLSEKVIAEVKKQGRDRVRDLIQGACDKINAQIEALGEIHFDTPSCRFFSMYKPQSYAERAPLPPTPKTPSFFAKFFKGVVAKVEAENAAAAAEHNLRVAVWTGEKSRFDSRELEKKQFFEEVKAGDVSAMEKHLEATLQDIVWPRETDVSFAIADDGKRIALAVDLPEIEDIPHRTASVPQRGYRLSIKEMGATQVQKLYMRHVHAVGFRIIGEAFAALPTIEMLSLSAYSQRANKQTGQIEDQYLYSVRVSRKDWETISFENLRALDVVEALVRFELRRSMSKTGAFKSIEPFED